MLVGVSHPLSTRTIPVLLRFERSEPIHVDLPLTEEP
jgi:hypothetical protein